MLDPPVDITRIFCSKCFDTIYLTLFDGIRFLGRLQLGLNPDLRSWMRVKPMALTEGEVDVQAMRTALPPRELITWDDHPVCDGWDQFEMRGLSSVWRLVLVSPVKLDNPTPREQVDTYTYLSRLRAIIWAEG